MNTELERLQTQLKEAKDSIRTWTQTALQARIYAHKLEAVLDEVCEDYLLHPNFLFHKSPLEQQLSMITANQSIKKENNNAK